MRKVLLYNKLKIRLISLIVTSLLLLPLLIQPLRQMIFLSQSGEIRKLDSKSDKLEKMVFTANAFARLNFTRGQNEFIYRGNMYDVHSITKSDNQVVVMVLWDTVESTMLQAFQMQDKVDGSALPGGTGIGFMPYFHVNPFNPNFQIFVFYQTDYQNINLIYSDPGFRICSPPPELLTFL